MFCEKRLAHRNIVSRKGFKYFKSWPPDLVINDARCVGHINSNNYYLQIAMNQILYVKVYILSHIEYIEKVCLIYNELGQLLLLPIGFELESLMFLYT